MDDHAPTTRAHCRCGAGIAWRQADQFRSDRGKSGLPAWPSSCYLPMAAWYAIVSGGKGPLPLDRIGDVGRLAALRSWRVTQGVYRFDQDLYEAVRSTPLEGDLPAAILYRLPEWCVYVEPPGYWVAVSMVFLPIWSGTPIRGGMSFDCSSIRRTF